MKDLDINYEIIGFWDKDSQDCLTITPENSTDKLWDFCLQSPIFNFKKNYVQKTHVGRTENQKLLLKILGIRFSYNISYQERDDYIKNINRKDEEIIEENENEDTIYNITKEK
jgi:hypothetical protein